MLDLTTLTTAESAAIVGGDDFVPIFPVAYLWLARAAVEAVQWLADNPPGAGNYAYCKTGIP